MYRLSGPNIIIFIPILIIGIFVVAFTPHYFMQSRIMSLVSLFIGEMGLSFIPVIALFPKATFIQAIILAVIYLLTTIAIFLGSWGINTLGWPGEYSFIIRDDELHINTFALFASNFFSLISLITNYRLVYDEDLTQKSKIPSKKPGIFNSFNKPKLNRPKFEESTKSPTETFDKPSASKIKDLGDDLEEDFWKPFDFEPEEKKASDTLPEESSGKLFSSKEVDVQKNESEFFDNEDSSKELKDPMFDLNPEDSSQKIIEKPKPIQISPFPPSNIKDELTAIFEQYSSLDAVKKITSSKPQKTIKRKSEEETKKTYSSPRKQISVKVEGEDIHEASFRQITDAEKIEEIKESLKKELEQEIKLKLNLDKESSKESVEAKENIIESIKNIKEELIESLKTEIKKEFSEIEQQSESLITEITFTDDELETMGQKLTEINKTNQLIGSMYLSYSGNVLSESWNERTEASSTENISKKAGQLFSQFNKQINKTKQGGLLHILLESKNGTLVMANEEDKLLVIQTKGTGEVYMGQLLRKLSELED